MSTLPVIFNFGTQSIRTIDKDGEVWFVASDVCAVLEVSNPTQAVQRLDDDERSMLNIGRQGDVHIINESGLFSLVLSSRKEQAKAFKRWVTHDVLPSIRKTGEYTAISGEPPLRVEAPKAALPPPADPVTPELRSAIKQRAWTLSHNAYEAYQAKMEADVAKGADLFDVNTWMPKDLSREVLMSAESIAYVIEKMSESIRRDARAMAKLMDYDYDNMFSPGRPAK